MNEVISHVVVFDANGKVKPGSLLPSTSARMLQTQGVVSMPISVEQLRRNGAGGYALKFFGSGWVLDAVSPRMICPLLLSVGSGESKLTWRAGLKLTAGVQCNGFLRIASDSSQVGTSGIGLGPSDMINLSDLDPTQSYAVVGSECNVSMLSDQFVGLSLYAKGEDCTVEWFAVSQSAR